MSHGEIRAGAKGENPERGVSILSRRLSTAEWQRCWRARVRFRCAGHLDISSKRLTSNNRSRSPSLAADHVQNYRRCSSHPAYVRRGQRSDLERGIDTRHHGVRGACFSAWVNGVAGLTFFSNTPSIDCSQPSSNESMRFSFPTACR